MSHSFCKMTEYFEEQICTILRTTKLFNREPFGCSISDAKYRGSRILDCLFL